MRRKDFLRIAGATLLTAGGRRVSANPLAAAPVPAAAGSELSRLESGLKVLCLPRHGFPLATVQMFYQVGSKHENPGTRGTARMLEGLMWKGSERVAPDVHRRFIQQVGGDVGGFVTEDVTAFHQTVPPEYVDFSLQLEAERMRGLTLFRPMVLARREQLLQERAARVDNNPVGRALELFREMVFGTHPYSWTTAGVARDLRRLDEQTCRAFYDRHFQPARAMVVVAGDVQTGEVQKLVTRHFGSLGAPAQGGSPQATMPIPFSAPTSGMEKHLRVPINVPVAVVGFHVPAADSKDAPALQVLADMIAGNPHGYAFRDMVLGGDAALVGGAARSLADAGLLVAFAVGKDGQDPRGLAASLRGAVAAALSGPEQAGLPAARKRLLAAVARDTGRIDGFAARVALSELVAGGAARFEQQVKDAAALKLEDLTRLAEQYLKPDRALVLTLEPERRDG